MQETNEFCWQDRSSWKNGFRMANNIACCCASMGTRILLTSLVDFVTGWVRSRFHAERTKVVDLKPLCRGKKKEKKDTDVCHIL